jgi:hypothetical protein
MWWPALLLSRQKNQKKLLLTLRFPLTFYAYISGGGKKKPKVDCDGCPGKIN